MIFRKVLLYIQNKFIGFDETEVNTFYTWEKSPDPWFLIGVPRVGSTLLYQVLIKYFSFGYVSNLMALVPVKMNLICRYTLRKNEMSTGKLKPSELGFIKGLYSPSELGKVCKFWFSNDRTEEEGKALRKSLKVLSAIQQKPLLIKNNANGLRIPEIMKIFPNAKFIYLKREIEFTAQSLYLNRIKINKDPEKWLSVEPPGFESVLTKPPFYQIIWQIKSIERIIENSLKGNESKFIEISYEALMKNPKEELQKLIPHLKQRVDWQALEGEKFEQGNRIRLDRRKWEELIDVMNQYPM